MPKQPDYVILELLQPTIYLLLSDIYPGNNNY